MTKNRRKFVKAMRAEKHSSGLVQRDCWAALVERIEAAKNRWRLLAHEAHKRRDAVAAWEAEWHIRDLERAMDTITPTVRPNAGSH
jgi:hypothetical protein